MRYLLLLSIFTLIQSFHIESSNLIERGLAFKLSGTPEQVRQQLIDLVPTKAHKKQLQSRYFVLYNDTNSTLHFWENSVGNRLAELQAQKMPFAYGTMGTSRIPLWEIHKHTLKNINEEIATQMEENDNNKKNTQKVKNFCLKALVLSLVHTASIIHMSLAAGGHVIGKCGGKWLAKRLISQPIVNALITKVFDDCTDISRLYWTRLKFFNTISVLPREYLIVPHQHSDFSDINLKQIAAFQQFELKRYTVTCALNPHLCRAHNLANYGATTTKLNFYGCSTCRNWHYYCTCPCSQCHEKKSVCICPPAPMKATDWFADKLPEHAQRFLADSWNEDKNIYLSPLAVVGIPIVFNSNEKEPQKIT